MGVWDLSFFVSSNNSISQKWTNGIHAQPLSSVGASRRLKNNQHTDLAIVLRLCFQFEAQENNSTCTTGSANLVLRLCFHSQRSSLNRNLIRHFALKRSKDFCKGYHYQLPQPPHSLNTWFSLEGLQCMSFLVFSSRQGWPSLIYQTQTENRPICLAGHATIL
jgi:hypothetical protein